MPENGRRIENRTVHLPRLARGDEAEVALIQVIAQMAVQFEHAIGRSGEDVSDVAPMAPALR